MKREIIKSQPQFPTFWSRAVILAVTLTALAVIAFSADVQTNVEDAKQMIKRGDKLVKTGDLLEAEKLFRQAMEQNPENSKAKLRLAGVYLKQRKLADAYTLSFAVAEAEPQNATAFSILGAAFLGYGKFEQARIVLNNALILNKKEASAWAQLGMLEFYENNMKESLADLREAVYRSPDNPDYLFSLAQVSARKEYYKEAADAYIKFLAISRDTDDERRTRIKGLINFLNFLGSKTGLYQSRGKESTVVPIEVVGNRPVINIKVNGKDRELRFVLDTGSGMTVISDETAKLLKVESITKGGFAKAIGGDGKFEIVYGFLQQIDIGEVQLNNIPVYIRKFHTTQGIDGYLGLSLISKYLTTLDYGNLQFSLDAHAPANPSNVTQSAISMPLRLTSSGFLSGEVHLDGVDAPLNFIVDTGASISVISNSLSRLDGITPYETDERMRVVGAAGITDNVPSFLLPRVRFGEHSRNDIAAIALNLDLINEASGFEQAGILGGNYLRNYSMTFDFKNSKVTFVPNSAKK